MTILRQCIRRYRSALAIAVGCMAVSLVADLMIPALLQRLIDNGVTPGDTATVRRMGALMGLVVVISLVASMLAYALSARATAKIGAHLRTELYAHILALSPETFNTLSAPTLITRLTNDVLQIQNMLLMVQRVAIGLPITFAVGLVLSIQLSPDLSLTYLVTVPLLALNIILYVRFSSLIFPQIQQTIDQINLRAQEMLVGILTIKGLRAAKTVIGRFRQASDWLLRLNLRIQKRFSIVGPTSMFIFNEAIVAVLCLGFFGFTADIGKLIAFISYSMQILSCVTRASGVLTMLARARASMARIQDVMNVPVQPPVADPAEPTG